MYLQPTPHPRRHSLAIAFLFALLILPCHAAAGQDAKELERNLYSRDSVAATAAAAEVLKDAARADPIDLMAAAIQVFKTGSHDSAAFWFHAGYLRTAYALRFMKSQKGLVVGYLWMAQPDIDAKAMLDVAKMTSMLDRVIAWDEATFKEWAAHNSLDEKSEDLQIARNQALKQIADLRQRLLADREKYEKQAREYKTTEQLIREKDEKFARDAAQYFSDAIIERTVGPNVLRLRTNYFTPIGLKPGLVLSPEMPITLLLPSLQPMTRENWRSPAVVGGMPQDRMLVTMVYKRGTTTYPDNDGQVVERYFKEFIASNPPTESEMGQEFYVYDDRKTNLPLPAIRSGYFHIAGEDRKEDSFYVMCRVSAYERVKKSLSCTGYFIDQMYGLYMRAPIPVEYVPMWKKIRTRFRQLLDEWVVR